LILIVVFFTPIVAALILTPTYGVTRLKKSFDLQTSIVQSVLLNTLIFIIGSVSLFHFEKDGIGQAIGWSIYAGCFTVFSIIDTIVLILYRKKQKAK